MLDFLLTSCDGLLVWLETLAFRPIVLPRLVPLSSTPLLGVPTPPPLPMKPSEVGEGGATEDSRDMGGELVWRCAIRLASEPGLRVVSREGTLV